MAKMNQSTRPTLPYASKEAFLSHGLSNVLLYAALDCSICREPLEVTLEHRSCGLPPRAVLSMGHTTVNAESEDLGICSKDSISTAFTDSTIEPEQAVRILPCNHTFGRTCLEEWFTTSKSNRCPECNQELFSQRHMMLFLRQPTRAMRLEFANYIEHMCGDAETASEIRERLMSDWTRLLIREVAMELWRQQGYDVEYQYISGADEEEEEDETEVEDMIDDDSDGEGDEDDIDDMDTDECEVDNRKEAEYGFVKKA
jgi:hypothetical protein